MIIRGLLMVNDAEKEIGLMTEGYLCFRLGTKHIALKLEPREIRVCICVLSGNAETLSIIKQKMRDSIQQRQNNNNCCIQLQQKINSNILRC